MVPAQSEEMYLVDPGGWLHAVPSTVFKEWCKEQLIKRPDNLLRSYKNRSSKGSPHLALTSPMRMAQAARGSHCTG